MTENRNPYGNCCCIDEDKCGPYQHHTKPNDGIFHIHELDYVKSYLVQLKVKVYSFIDFTQNSVSYSDKKSYLSWGAKKCFQICDVTMKKTLVANKFTINIYFCWLFYLFNYLFSFVLLVVLSQKWLSDQLLSLKRY